MEKSSLVHSLGKLVKDKELARVTHDLGVAGFDRPSIQHDLVRDKERVIPDQHVAFRGFIGIDPYTGSARGISPEVDLLGCSRHLEMTFFASAVGSIKVADIRYAPKIGGALLSRGGAGEKAQDEHGYSVQDTAKGRKAKG